MKSPVVSSQDYYPFGVAFNSNSRERALNSHDQYNAKEVQDELSLGWLDYGARMYMSDLGRWFVVDPLSNFYLDYSPYNYVKNRPVSHLDPTGMYDVYFNGEKITGRNARRANRYFNSMLKADHPKTEESDAKPNSECPPGVPCNQEFDKDGKLVSQTNGEAYGADGMEKAAEFIGEGIQEVLIETAIMYSGGKVISLVFKGGKWIYRASKIAKLAKGAKGSGIFSAQEAGVNSKIVDKYFNKMMNGTFSETSGAAGFIHEGKYILTEGNHRMTAALKYAMETGDMKFVNSIIEQGRFQAANPSSYGYKIFNFGF